MNSVPVPVPVPVQASAPGPNHLYTEDEHEVSVILSTLCRSPTPPSPPVPSQLLDRSFWERIASIPEEKKQTIQNKSKYILSNFGTSEPCNRFDVGNSLEFLLADMLRDAGFTVTSLPNAKRIDISVNGTYNLSIKYSSTGDVTLHNSNSTTNTDTSFTNTLLLTPTNLYLITNENLTEYNVTIGDYLQNTGDSLKLKRKILSKLESVQFPYKIPFDITINKKECKNRLCAELFYKQVMSEYENSNA